MTIALPQPDPCNRNGERGELVCTARRDQQFDAEEGKADPMAPLDPAAAEQFKEQQKKLAESTLLTSLKSAAKNVIFDMGRNESGYASWKLIIEYAKKELTRAGDDMPDFSFPFTDVAINKILESSPVDSADEVRRLFGTGSGAHQFQMRLLPERITHDCPGGLFCRTDAGAAG